MKVATHYALNFYICVDVFIVSRTVFRLCFEASGGF